MSIFSSTSRTIRDPAWHGRQASAMFSGEDPKTHKNKISLNLVNLEVDDALAIGAAVGGSWGNNSATYLALSAANVNVKGATYSGPIGETETYWKDARQPGTIGIARASQ